MSPATALYSAAEQLACIGGICQNLRLSLFQEYKPKLLPVQSAGGVSSLLVSLVACVCFGSSGGVCHSGE